MVGGEGGRMGCVGLGSPGNPSHLRISAAHLLPAAVGSLLAIQVF